MSLVHCFPIQSGYLISPAPDYATTGMLFIGWALWFSAFAYSAKTRAAGDSIKPGGVSPGNGQKELTKPVERATADRNTRPVIATSVARCRGLIVLN
ncbi:MAG TPA: hypothetical protein VKD91_00060 [Pyrinomonadaceae bacterium]|nr:hypothetical protein [Pyrinomonadaceae bacterium]